MLGPAGTALLLEDEGTQLLHPDRRAARSLSNCVKRECMGWPSLCFLAALVAVCSHKPSGFSL